MEIKVLGTGCCSQQQTKFVHSTIGYPARYSLGVIPVWVLKNL